MSLSLGEAAAVVEAFFEMALVGVLVPDFLKFRDERRRIRARTAINFEIIDPHKIRQPVYGGKDILGNIDDIVDRVRFPDHYQSINPSNEILIVGPPGAGKTSRALQIAREAGIHRAIVVYNSRDSDTLAHAKKIIDHHPSFLWQAATRVFTKHAPKIDLLLLPGLDNVTTNNGDPWLDQLQALVEVASQNPNVLVIATTEQYQSTNKIASWFGTVLEFPQRDNAEWKVMTQEIAKGYLESTKILGYKLKDIKDEDFIKQTLEQKPTPADIQDIFVHCQTLAVYQRKKQSQSDLELTSEILSMAIKRVNRPELTAPSRADDWHNT